MQFGFAAVALASLSLSPASLGPRWAIPKEVFGGAVPLNERSWFTVDDYPDKAALWHQGGYVTVSFTIGTDGRASNCQVVRSTGYPLLDEVPCRLLIKRARFAPAKDSAGVPVATHGSTSMGFWSPE